MLGIVDIMLGIAGVGMYIVMMEVGVVEVEVVEKGQGGMVALDGEHGE